MYSLRDLRQACDPTADLSPYAVHPLYGRNGRRMTVLYGNGSAVRRTVDLVQTRLRYGRVAVRRQPSPVMYGAGAQPYLRRYRSYTTLF